MSSAITNPPDSGPGIGTGAETAGGLSRRIAAMHAWLDRRGVPTDDGPSRAADAAADVDRLARRIDAASLSPTVRATLVHLVVLARYPRPAEAATPDSAPPETSRTLGERLIAGEEFRALDESADRWHLRFLDAGTLVLAVTHTASYPLNTGIQRVVRSLCAALRDAGTRHVLLDFPERAERPRVLDGDAARRILDWEAPELATTGDGGPARRRSLPVRWVRGLGIGARDAAIAWTREVLSDARDRERWERRIRGFSARAGKLLGAGGPVASAGVVPVLLDVRLVVPEIVDRREEVEQILSLRATLPVSLGVVLYDLIPVLFPQYCVTPLVAAFADHLRLVSSADRVSCISRGVAEQASHYERLTRPRGATGGATGPEIAAHPLPTEGIARGRRPGAASAVPTATAVPGVPRLLCVGTIEPRKNGARILRAAARVVREGVPFELVFAGNPGWSLEPFLAEMERSRAAGLRVSWVTGASDADLDALYAGSRAVVFCSLSEGFGLPVAEALARGCPVVASDVTGVAEVASGGGCLLVDPADVAAIAAAMRTVLTDDAAHARLVAEIALRPVRTWDAYARELDRFFEAPPPSGRAG